LQLGRGEPLGEGDEPDDDPGDTAAEDDGARQDRGQAASCRVAEKTGFAAEAVRRSAWLLADGRCDVHAHARLR
jgi:hypothetical protein